MFLEGGVGEGGVGGGGGGGETSRQSCRIDQTRGPSVSFSISFSVLKREEGRRRVLNSFSSLERKVAEGFFLPNSFCLLKRREGEGFVFPNSFSLLKSRGRFYSPKLIKYSRRGGFQSPKLLLLIKKEGMLSFSQPSSPY